MVGDKESRMETRAPLSLQYTYKQDGRYTPVTAELMGWFEELRQKHGSWAQVCRVTRMSNRHFRHIRSGWFAVIGIDVVDKILTRGESAHRVDELEWLTVAQILERGYWQPHADGRAVAFKTRRQVLEERRNGN